MHVSRKLRCWKCNYRDALKLRLLWLKNCKSRTGIWIHSVRVWHRFCARWPVTRGWGGDSRSLDKGHFLTLYVKMPCLWPYPQRFSSDQHLQLLCMLSLWSIIGVEPKVLALPSLLLPGDHRAAKSRGSRKDCLAQGTDLEDSQGFSKVLVKLLQRLPPLRFLQRSQKVRKVFNEGLKKDY